jgi:hypothetical protein
VASVNLTTCGNDEKRTTQIAPALSHEPNKSQ